MTFDPEAFEERAAIQEHDGGMSRFRAETLAARAQGVERWQAIGEVARGVVEDERDRRAEMAREPRADDVSRVQPTPTEEG